MRSFKYRMILHDPHRTIQFPVFATLIRAFAPTHMGQIQMNLSCAFNVGCGIGYPSSPMITVEGNGFSFFLGIMFFLYMIIIVILVAYYGLGVYLSMYGITIFTKVRLHGRF